MIQMFKLSQSGASTCYALSGKYYDKTYIYSQRLQNCSTVRNQSDSYVSRTALNKTVVKKKRSPGSSKRVKETELLKVTAKEATQTTMTIGKLNASHIAAFAEEPGMILKNVKNKKILRDNTKNNLFSAATLKFQNDSLGCVDSHVKNVSNFKSQLRAVTNNFKTNPWETNKVEYFDGNSNVKYKEKEQENVASSYQSSSNNLLRERILSVMNSEVPEEQNEIVNSYGNELVDRIKSEELQENNEKSGLQHFVTNSQKGEAWKLEQSRQMDMTTDPVDIHAYIDVCVHSNLLDHAFTVLTSNRGEKVKNPQVYQTLLRKFAEKGDWFQAQLLLKKMENFNVKDTPQTFALYLLSVANGEPCDALERTELTLKKIQNKGFKIDELFTKTFLKLEEREIVLSQIRKIMPHLDIPPTTVNLNSNNPLVQNFYKNQEPLKSPAPFLNKENISKIIEEQLLMEENQVCTVNKIGGSAAYSAKHRNIWMNLKEKWEKRFRRIFASTVEALKEDFEKNQSYKNNIYPYLLTISSENFVQIAMEEIDQLVLISQGYSESTYMLFEALGERVYQMYCKEKRTMDEERSRRMKRQIEIYCNWYANPNGPARNARQKWQMLMGDNPDIASAITSYENIPWPHFVESAIGKFIYSIIFKSALIPARYVSSNFSGDVPAFYLVLRCKKLKLREEIKFHPCIATIIKKANFNTMTFPAYLMPMLCPPKPWSSTDNGGYYCLSTQLLRSHSEKINKDLVKSVPNQNLYAVFDALNKLQSVPWSINEEVLNVALEIFTTGGSQELDVPVKPDEKPLAKIPRNLDYVTKNKLFREQKEILQKRQSQYGLWCEALYKLSLANHFRKKVFWLPQNLDFRGRIYPVPPHVSQISADLYRSFLLFAEKKRLGDKGLDWLKTHVINLTGSHKKKNLRERLEYANEVLPDILDSAENPLKGRKWWVNSDDPWQTLAACFEIRNAIRSGNPEMYESGLPVHQDGSCNGLQHYAALGRDMNGAISVNLSPADSPQDVYSDVAALLEEERAKDEAKGVEIAKLLNGFVSRKIVKRPVMTTVYGVTWFGAKLQIAGVLEDTPEFPKHMITPASSYLATKMFVTLRKLFTSAKEIQDWFYKCSDVITGSCKNTISWETPIGLPVIQPYFSKSKLKPSGTQKPDTRKQKNGFAPNFIHSLDSTHLMLTALHCEPAGITFASVHDCFWTHPAQVDHMNKICRENFVALHSLPILENLSQHFIKTYSTNEDSNDAVFRSIPKRGDFDLNSVIHSVYFFA